MESFFGTFKDWVDYKSCESLDDLKHQVNNYIEKYNNERYQWGLNKMTPVQYRGHLRLFYFNLKHIVIYQLLKFANGLVQVIPLSI